MGKKRSEITVPTFAGLTQAMTSSDGFLATEINFFATLTD
ncbi:hypothetical protein OKW09_002474 [Pseudomonas rhodesiae]|jgi:hypothetical protein|nr:hypothetical protein [Pseudomonas rhodesiae]MDF9770189.1 hypothetical protein [Pseudomonas rhodesiae]